MNILIFTNAYLPDIGGVQWTVHHLGRRYAARGHAVRVVTEWKEGFDDALPEQQESDGMRILRMRVRRRRPVTRLRIWKWLRRNETLIRDADIIHFYDHGTLVDWFLPFRFLHPGKRYVITHCGFDSWPIRRKHRWRRRLADRLVDGHVHVGSWIAEFYGSRREICYVGAPVHDSGDIPAPERFTFAFLGRLEADTGFDVQLAALVRLSDRSDEPMTLLVCGEGSLGGLLRDAESPRLRIVRHGTVENIRKTCGRAELIFASSYLAIFDALAMGRAVVSYAASDLKRSYLRDIPEIRDCVYFAEQPGDLDLLLEEAFRDPDSRERKRRAAKKLLASLSWDRTADEHLALYRRLLERRR